MTALLLTSAMRSHLRFGQVGAFLVLAVAVDLVGHRRPGLGLGCAAAVKLTPLVYLPWLLLTRDTERLRRTLLTVVGCSAAGLLLLWPSAGDYVLSAAWDSSRFGPNDIPGNQSVRGMLLRAGVPAAGLIWLAVSLALAIVGTRNAVRLERSGHRLGAVAVLAALSVAVSPISWVHHLVWLSFAVSALVAAGHLRLAAGWCVLLVLSPPALGTAGSHRWPEQESLWQLVVNAQGLTAVAAVLLLPVLLRSEGPAPAAPCPASAPPPLARAPHS